MSQFLYDNAKAIAIPRVFYEKSQAKNKMSCTLNTSAKGIHSLQPVQSLQAATSQNLLPLTNFSVNPFPNNKFYTLQN